MLKGPSSKGKRRALLVLAFHARTCAREPTTCQHNATIVLYASHHHHRRTSVTFKLYSIINRINQRYCTHSHHLTHCDTEVMAVAAVSDTFSTQATLYIYLLIVNYLACNNRQLYISYTYSIYII